MPIGIVIAVAAVLVIVAAVVSHFVTISNLRKNAESKIGNAESRAREIIDDAVKTAEAKKKESLLEIKEESIKTKNELEKETKERRAVSCFTSSSTVFNKYSFACSEVSPEILSSSCTLCLLSSSTFASR